jgi:hypothetical protein
VWGCNATRQAFPFELVENVTFGSASAPWHSRQIETTIKNARAGIFPCSKRGSLPVWRIVGFLTSGPHVSDNMPSECALSGGPERQCGLRRERDRRAVLVPLSRFELVTCNA